MASYNCSDSSNSAYGAGDFGTCEQSVGAPNTGLFGEVISSASFTIIVPLVVAIVVVVVASILVRRQKKTD